MPPGIPPDGGAGIDPSVGSVALTFDEHPAEVIVVYDGSTDGTAEAASPPRSTPVSLRPTTTSSC
jgi:hypothetical protein